MPRPAWYPTAARSWADARRRHSATHHPPRVNRVATLTGGPAPLSSRGLGRRPLTAETGVRIPVAVPHAARLPRRVSSLRNFHWTAFRVYTAGETATCRHDARR